MLPRFSENFFILVDISEIKSILFHFCIYFLENRTNGADRMTPSFNLYACIYMWIVAIQMLLAKSSNLKQICY